MAAGAGRSVHVSFTVQGNHVQALMFMQVRLVGLIIKPELHVQVRPLKSPRAGAGRSVHVAWSMHGAMLQALVSTHEPSTVKLRPWAH